MTRLLAIAAAVIVLAGGAYWYFTQQNASTPVADAGAPSADIDTSGVIEMSLGNPDADVTVIEYASYSCPHCRNFHDGPFKDLKADYIDTGKIHFIYREVFFRDDLAALWAGMVARCAGPDRFFGVVDEIYRQQEAWSRQATAADAATALRRIGLTAGIEEDALEACLSDGDMAQAMAAVDATNRTEHNIRSTPSFVINGTTHGNVSTDYSAFTSLIDDELGS